jgi:hypothetical protein
VRNNWGHQLLSNPRTGVLEYSQPSLAGLFLVSSLPRTSVLGYSQPSLRDSVRTGVLTQVPSPNVFDIKRSGYLVALSLSGGMPCARIFARCPLCSSPVR